MIPRDACAPNPCGLYSQCRDVGGYPSCSCSINYQGSPPNCRPECRINSDCSMNLACVNERCRDPCQGSCGVLAICSVHNHISSCICPEGYSGDPFSSCSIVPTTRKTIDILDFRESADFMNSAYMKHIFLVAPQNTDPCYPSPCGSNAQCRDGICSCLSNYNGDPYSGCRPECVANSDCPQNRACSRNRCIDPCPSTCGRNALCNVYNHIPMCSCPVGMSGNAFVACDFVRGMIPKPDSLFFVQKSSFSQFSNSLRNTEPVNTDPCNPSPCGPNSRCRPVNDQAVCTCVPGFLGNPPTCRPECTVATDCPMNQACSNQKCIDPCLGSCGLRATCQVINHNPICSCPSGMTGDPFTACEQERKISFRIRSQFLLFLQLLHSIIIQLQLQFVRHIKIPANRPPAVPTPSAKSSTNLHPALAYQNSLEAHQTVVQSALATANVPII